MDQTQVILPLKKIALVTWSYEGRLRHMLRTPWFMQSCRRQDVGIKFQPFISIKGAWLTWTSKISKLNKNGKRVLSDF